MGLMMMNRFLTNWYNICPCLSRLPQCISNACPYLHVCSLNLTCFSCQLDNPYGFSGDHLQNAAMFQCVSRYIQSISVTVSLLYYVGNKTYNYFYCYCYYVYERGCWHMYIDTAPGSVPSKASSSYCLLADGQTFPYLTGLNRFAICINLCSSYRCWGKCNLIISMTFYTC